MSSYATTRGGRQRLSRPRRWCQGGVRTAALSLALTAGAASGLAAAPAWAAGGYHVTATIGVGLRPVEVAVSPDGTRAYVTNGSSDTVSVINTAANQVAATIGVRSGPSGVAVSPDSAHIYVTNEMTRGTVSVITRQ